MKKEFFAKMLSTISMLFFLLSLGGCGYNTMQKNDEAVVAAWGNVEATYQRRADLIPSLVEVVKGYASHERETMKAVTEARAKVGQMRIDASMLNNPETIRKFQAAQGELSSALTRLMAVSENYPDLKANQNFLDLQHQLEGTENRINVARTRYNEAVRVYNSSIRVFPNNLTNNFLLHLERREAFKADQGASKAPTVKFQ